MKITYVPVIGSLCLNEFSVLGPDIFVEPERCQYEFAENPLAGRVSFNALFARQLHPLDTW